MMAEGRKATAEMIAKANPPKGFQPIVSTSPFGWENGPMFETQEGESWARGFRVMEKHTNVAGMCHGGMLMTFADIFLSRAVMDVAPFPFVTVRLTTDFIGPAKLGDWVEGTAIARGAGNKLVAVSGEIYTEQSIVGTVSGLFKCFGEKLKR